MDVGQRLTERMGEMEKFANVIAVRVLSFQGDLFGLDEKLACRMEIQARVNRLHESEMVV